MSNDPVSDYLEAYREMAEARRKAMVLIDVINDASRKFQKEWRQVSVTDVGIKFGWGQDAHINGRSWPTSLEMAEVLAAYRGAVLTASQAYVKIPESQRRLVNAPPKNQYG